MSDQLIRREIEPGPDDPPAFESIENAVRALSGYLKFFPRDKEAQAKVAELLVFLCSTQGQLDWLIDEMTSGERFNDWPGPQKLREMFCEKYAPADGRIPESIQAAIAERESKELPEYYREWKRIEEPAATPMTPEEEAEFQAENRRIMDRIKAKGKVAIAADPRYVPPDWMASCVGWREVEAFKNKGGKR